MSTRAASFGPEDISPVIQPLIEQLCTQLERADIEPVGPLLAYYEDAPDAGVMVHAAFPVSDDAVASGELAITELPEIEQAATLVHRGPMDDVIPSVQALAQWIDAHGYKSTGYNRELYLNYGAGDPDTWRTELQEPVDG